MGLDESQLRHFHLFLSFQDPAARERGRAIGKIGANHPKHGNPVVAEGVFCYMATI